MEAYSILLLIGILFFIICSFLTNKIIRIAIASAGAMFFVAQATSLYFTQTFIGYQFYVHCNLNATKDFSYYFLFHILAAIILFCILLFVFFKKSNFHKSRIFKILSIIYIVLSIIAICSNQKFRHDSSTLKSIFSNEALSFQNALNQNNMSDYTLARHIVCKNKSKRNIIVLSLESYEKSFIEDKQFENLTPNLRQLKRNWHYYPLTQNIGSTWTSGSIYTYLTGFPAFFGIHGNSIFQSSYHTEITSVSQILKQTNHKTFFIIGNAEHSGLQDMLITLSVDSIIDNQTFKNTYPESNYGLRDKDLFNIAKIVISEQKNNEQPFALFISTTDTHAPDGIYDKRIEDILNRKNYKNDLEFMVAAVDFMIADFVSFLKQENILENTTLFIFPDHLKMGNPAMFKDCERGLFLLSNSSNDLLKIKDQNPIYQIDLPKIILNGADIQHNAKFLTDYINSDISYLEKHIEKLTAININGLLRSDTIRIPKKFKK